MKIYAAKNAVLSYRIQARHWLLAGLLTVPQLGMASVIKNADDIGRHKALPYIAATHIDPLIKIEGFVDNKQVYCKDNALVKKLTDNSGLADDSDYFLDQVIGKAVCLPNITDALYMVHSEEQQPDQHNTDYLIGSIPSSDIRYQSNKNRGYSRTASAVLSYSGRDSIQRNVSQTASTLSTTGNTTSQPSETNNIAIVENQPAISHSGATILPAVNANQATPSSAELPVNQDSELASGFQDAVQQPNNNLSNFEQTAFQSPPSNTVLHSEQLSPADAINRVAQAASSDESYSDANQMGTHRVDSINSVVQNGNTVESMQTVSNPVLPEHLSTAGSLLASAPQLSQSRQQGKPVTSVPEPSSWLLFASGLLFLFRKLVI